MAQVIPIKDYILLELPANTGKIILPDKRDTTVVEVCNFIVLKTGPDCKKVKIGDRLVADVKAFAVAKVDGKRYFITREENVGCIIR